MPPRVASRLLVEYGEAGGGCHISEGEEGTEGGDDRGGSRCAGWTAPVVSFGRTWMRVRVRVRARLRRRLRLGSLGRTTREHRGKKDSRDLRHTQCTDPLVNRMHTDECLHYVSLWPLPQAAPTRWRW